MLNHRWLMPSGVPATFSPEFLAQAQNSTLLAKLLWQRGIQTPEAAQAFLNLTEYQPTSGMELPDAQQALDRIIQAIDGNEGILVYGDFDVDGQTGTSILMLALTACGANVSFYIPDRAAEGHGMNAAAVCRLASSRQPKLVITTDTGITDFNEVSLLNGLGVDTIITDHHELPENLPQAIANVNPKCLNNASHPLYNLCGAGVAFKLCELLLAHYNQPESLRNHLLGIAAIGTVADMMPLVGENRWLVWQGCQILNLKQHVGVNALLEITGNDPAQTTITSDTIGFSIGPRLNALGRLERADDGVVLLTTTNTEEAQRIAQHLENLNKKRQDMCDECLLGAEKALAAQGGLNGEKAIVLASPDWHPGIVGLAATRLKERYQVPVFLMLVGDDETRGSARSIEGVDLHHILCQFANTFTHFGGHAGAGGFAMANEKYRTFKEQLLAYCRTHIAEELCQPHIKIDAELGWSQLHPGLVELTDALAPFGMANPAPTFATTDVVVKAKRSMGKANQHLKLILAPPKGNTEGSDIANIDALAWNTDADEAPMPGSTLRCAFQPGVNTFNGKTSFQMLLKSIQGSGAATITSASKTIAVATAPLPEPAATATAVASPQILAQSGPVWLDHRQRHQLTPLLAQLMQPGQSVGLFVEQPNLPEIPFITEGHCLSRAQWQPVEQLVLWDLPPSSLALAQLIQHTQPSAIHVVGHPYQQGHAETLSLTPWLRNAYKHWRQWHQHHGDSITLPQLASVLATTPTMALAMGCLFAQAQLLTFISNPAATTLTVNFTQPTQRPTMEALPEYTLVQRHWEEQQRFAQFMMTAPLSTLQNHIRAMTESLTYMAMPVTPTTDTLPPLSEQPLQPTTDPRPVALSGVS